MVEYFKRKRFKKGIQELFSKRRGLSPIFSTLILAAIVIISGTVTYLYANNLATTATNNYVSESSNDQYALSERVGFENIVYNPSSRTLTVSIINCGSINLKITNTFVNDMQGQPAGGIQQVSLLIALPGSQIAPDHSLNVNQEGYFTIPISLLNGTYTVNLVSARGSTFDYRFTT